MTKFHIIIISNSGAVDIFVYKRLRKKSRNRKGTHLNFSNIPGLELVSKNIYVRDIPNEQVINATK